jgi:hypothetical protein
MQRSAFVTIAAVLLVAVARPADASERFRSNLKGNVANQVIAGFPSSVVTWDAARGHVSISRIGDGLALVVVVTKRLIIPALGFNPSPDLLARIVCHDATGVPAEAARSRAVPFPQSGDAVLVDIVSLPDDCFAPIMLLTGSIDPQGEQPGKFFAVSGF